MGQRRSEYPETCCQAVIKDRKEVNGSLTDTFPISYDRRTAIIHGPVTTTILPDLIAQVVNGAQRHSESDARFGVVRLGRAANSHKPTGFEGWFVDSEDPTRELVALTAPHVARMFKPDHIGPHWEKAVLARERHILSLVDRLRSGAVLDLTELQQGDTLMSMLVAKCRARAAMAKDQSKLRDFFLTTQYYVQNGRKPQFRCVGECGHPDAIEVHWPRSPRCEVAPDVNLSATHLNGAEQLVLEFLSEVGRFGTPLARNLVRAKEQSFGMNFLR